MGQVDVTGFGSLSDKNYSAAATDVASCEKTIFLDPIKNTCNKPNSTDMLCILRSRSQFGMLSVKDKLSVLNV